MTEYNRLEHLKQLHEKRRETTIKKVDEAIKRLIKAKEVINFNSIANEAGVSKATLYNNGDIRVRIEKLRSQQVNVANPKQIKREIDENNKDAIIASLTRRVKKLEEENQQLKKQIKISYSDVWKNV
jgi:hypothetical protein